MVLTVLSFKETKMEHLLKIKTLDDDKFIELQEVIHLLGISKNSIHRISQRGQLHRYKFNGRNYYSSSELKDMVNRILNGGGYYTNLLSDNG